MAEPMRMAPTTTDRPANKPLEDKPSTITPVLDSMGNPMARPSPPNSTRNAPMISAPIRWIVCTG
jgi:hypothetical protein